MSTRLLIADTNKNFNIALKKFLQERGFDVFIASDGQETLKMIITHKPKMVLMDLLLPKVNALSILKQIQPNNPESIFDTQFIILSNQTSVHNIKECMRLGAADFLVKPIEIEEVVPRIIFHLQKSNKKTQSVPNETDGPNLYLHLTEMVVRQSLELDNLEETFYKLTQMCAMALKSVRVSIIQCEPHRRGIVRGSSDDQTGRPWMLDLRKYPEILYVINSGKCLTIENIDNDQNIAHIKEHFANIQFNSMIVTPIYTNKDTFFGVLAIRMPQSRRTILEQEVRFAQIVAHIVGLTVRMYPTSALNVA
jgi:DNA-binding response OmpR family regulator